MQPAEQLEGLVRGGLCPNSQNKSRQGPAITRGSANCIMRAPLGPQGTEGSSHPPDPHGEGWGGARNPDIQQAGPWKEAPLGIGAWLHLFCEPISETQFPFPPQARQISRRRPRRVLVSGSPGSRAAGSLPSVGRRMPPACPAQATPSPFCDLELY